MNFTPSQPAHPRRTPSASPPAWPPPSPQDVLNVGSYPNNPPFEFKAESGNFEGFEVDIVTEAAKRIGMTVNIEGYDFQPLFAATSSGRIDVAISSITITKERLGSQSFTQPYYDSDMGVAAKTDGAVKSLADLKEQGRRRPLRLDRREMVKDNQEAQGFSRGQGLQHPAGSAARSRRRPRRRRGQRRPGMEYAFTKMKGLARRRTHQDRRAVRPDGDQGFAPARTSSTTP